MWNDMNSNYKKQYFPWLAQQSRVISMSQNSKKKSIQEFKNVAAIIKKILTIIDFDKRYLVNVALLRIIKMWRDRKVFPTIKIGIKIIKVLVTVCAKYEKIKEDVFCYSRSKIKVKWKIFLITLVGTQCID